ncbi:Na(+)-translocating NADH-quinone reductase subunit A [Phocaeicola abscessus]|uniref:Na(+)-translocating NADH-quinone reductase subunit A n=1 Tax=Phocaeicola abscessus TaxID=555313 RepID=UPI00055E9417|nr:Na(+)-translocating NADH-quinone reductase subunit A [Phocaeicola abscessus]
MANVIKLHKGLDINLKGKPAEELLEVKIPETYALVPDDFHGIIPKVVVKEQDYVKAGDTLFVDKKHPEVKFVSPVSGVVTNVTRGERRKVLNISVAASKEQDYVDFGRKEVSKMNGEEVKTALLESGLFAFFIERPYAVVADPTAKVKAIFVSAFDKHPLAANFEFVLQGQENDFQTGLNALAKLAKTYLNICVSQKTSALTNAQQVTVTAFDGPNPAGNAGVQINHISPINKGETVWTLGAEEVIFIGRLFNTGRVDFTRTVALTGSEVVKPAYCKLKVGAQLSGIFKGKVSTDKKLRYISGNVLTGKKIPADGFLGAHATSLTVIPEGDKEDEFLGFIMPRCNQFSVNRSYFSWLQGKKEYTLDARIKGGERHLIMSGEYDRVFPMDIYPEYLIKAILAGDIDRMEALGIYEVAPEDFALCEFVDSSKLEVQRIVRQGLDMLRKELC